MIHSMVSGFEHENSFKTLGSSVMCFNETRFYCKLIYICTCTIKIDNYDINGNKCLTDHMPGNRVEFRPINFKVGVIFLSHNDGFLDTPKPIRSIAFLPS